MDRLLFWAVFLITAVTTSLVWIAVPDMGKSTTVAFGLGVVLTMSIGTLWMIYNHLDD